MENNKYLQRMFDLESDLDDAGPQITATIDNVLSKIEDGNSVSDSDWGVIALQIAVTRSLLDRLERALIKARAEQHLEWQTPH
jgi:hypothetical protein